MAKWIKQARASRPNIVRATFHYTDPCKWILFNPRHALPPEFSRITRVLFNKGFLARSHPQNHISHRWHYIGMYENASKPFSKNALLYFNCALRAPYPSPSACGLAHHPTNAISNSPSFGLRMMSINPYLSNMQNPSISEPYSANSPHKMGRKKRLVYLLGRHVLSIDITNLYKKPYHTMSIVKVKYILIIIKE